MKKQAFGGVVFDEQGRVLLREPKNHYDGTVWTFAKGRPDAGETPEQTALREVVEETGIEAEIVCEIPGSFDGATTTNRYFVMKAVGDRGTFHWETESIRWVDPSEAPALINMSRKGSARQRDNAVLQSALELWASQDPSA